MNYTFVLFFTNFFAYKYNNSIIEFSTIQRKFQNAVKSFLVTQRRKETKPLVSDGGEAICTSSACLYILSRT